MAEVESRLVSEYPKQILNKEPDDDDDKYGYAYFYGTDSEDEDTAQEVNYEEKNTGEEIIYDGEDSDGEDSDGDGEDWPAAQIECGPPFYRSNRKAVEEIRRLNAFHSVHGTVFSKKWCTTLTAPQPPEPLPLPPPPSLNVQQPPPLSPEPSPLSSLSIKELVKLLGEELAKLRDPSAPGLERQTEALHPVFKKARVMPA